MEIIDNIYSLAQQIFQLIQHQEIEITINQQTIHYKNTVKIPQNKAQKRLENVVNKIMTKIKLAIKEQQIVRYTKNLPKKLGLGGYNNFQKTINLYMDKTKWLFNTTILQQLEHFDRPEILLNKAMDTVTNNQLGKITNAQFKEL
ncbi:hypothetical protein G9A89_007801 [Geosiphon pyriformis]|nr:hypothetical protein G9A89_007801 [Geosiphon pyriformis]